jgi:hypothetical protein
MFCLPPLVLSSPHRDMAPPPPQPDDPPPQPGDLPPTPSSSDPSPTSLPQPDGLPTAVVQATAPGALGVLLGEAAVAAHGLAAMEDHGMAVTEAQAGEVMAAASTEGQGTLAASSSTAIALARALMPTVTHPAREHHLPVLDVQRY